MYEFKLKFLPVIIVAASVAAAAETTPEMRGTINRVDLGRQEVSDRAGAHVRAANELFVNGQYREACARYRDAISAYEQFAPYTPFSEKIEYCQKRIRECYYRMALEAMHKADDLAQSRDYDEAIKICREALKYCEPEQKEELNRLIVIYEKRRDTAMEREAAAADQLVPNLKAQEYQVQVLMEQGRKLALNREYGRAARKFQEVLLINPFNADALQCLRAVNDRIGSIGLRRYKDEHRKMLSELEWKAATPYQPFAESSAQNLLDSGTAKKKPESKGNELHRRLNDIKLPKVVLADMTVSEVVDYIRAESIRHDPDKRGVNIVFLRTLPKKNKDDAQNANNNVGEDGADQPRQNANNTPEDQIGEEHITLNITNRSVLEVLDILCERTSAPKMCYQVDENAVLISPENLELGGMLTEAIHINLEEGTTDDALKNDMITNGIVFRPGAGVTYNAKLGRVVIKNDSKNLEKMKAFLESRKTNDEAMVQLQIKLVEMTQADIDELAFNWQYAVNTNQSYYTGGANTTTPLSNDRQLSRATIMQQSSNELLRYYIPDTTHSTTKFQDANYSFTWANSDGTKVSASMFALDWADSQDVLASPRVTTLPGHTAKIEMVTIRYFPEDWDTIDVDTQYGTGTTFSITRVTAQPNLDKEKKLGPIFEIKPDIITRGDEKLIKMHLHFPITTFSDEWIIYDNTQGNDDGDYIQMPVFNTRTITCDVILGDGETIVLGGVNRDDTTTVNDKIPILGDIPIIGRLFQSKYSNATKGNLLIFLTGRLVKPDGSAYNPAKQIQRGLPNFGRIE